MVRYRNRGGASGVVGYEVNDEGIKVKFHDDAVYLYTDESAGSDNIREMTKLAEAGKGLNGFINREVRKRYAARLR